MRHAVAIVVAVALCLGAPPRGATADTLRVCADPDNLPFSREGPGVRGLYVDVAELVAARLGMRTEYAWWRTYFGMRAVRSTLLADRCDVFFGLPYTTEFMGRSLTLTQPFLDVGYAIMARDEERAKALDGRRVAVVFGSTPQLTLAARGGVQTVTFRAPEDALDALARDEVDAAFVWGPTAGYYNLTRLGGRYAVVPIAGEGLQWKVTAAVKKGNEALKEAIERTLAPLEGEIRRLADGYGFPRGAPVELAATPAGAAPAAPTSDVVVNPFRGNPEAINAGRRTFNHHCAHCHGPNAFNPEPSRDLRRLKRRYADESAQVFYGAVAAGRPTRGMPTWGDVLDADTIWRIWAFLETVQLEP